MPLEPQTLGFLALQAPVLLKAVRFLERLPLSLLQAGDYLELLEGEDCLEMLQANRRLVDLEGLQHLEVRQTHSQHQVN
jgi:hypothetical protein